MALDAEKRIPDTTLPANSFKDGDILYGSDMNRVVDTLKTAVNENYKDLKGAVKGGDAIYIEPIEGVVDAEGQPIDTVDGLIKWLYDNKILNEGKVHSLRINDLGQFEYYDGINWLLATVGQQGDPGEGVPTGGLFGQFLRKRSNVSYDTEWVDAYDKEQVDSKVAIQNTAISNIQGKVDALTGTKEITLGTVWDSNTQVVSVPEIKSTDMPIIVVKLEGEIEQMTEQRDEFSKILKAETSDGAITFTCTEPTTINLPLIVRGIAVEDTTVVDGDSIQY